MLAGSPTIRNCAFREGYAYGAGGALHVAYNQTATVSNCLFRYSGSYRGGAVTLFHSSLTLNDCDFDSNSATWRGGAVEAFFGTHLTMNGCNFGGNFAEFGASAILLDSGTWVEQNRCTFRNNFSYEGGGFTIGYGAYTSVRDCVFDANFAWYYGGGGATVFYAAADLVNCVFRGNRAGWGGGIFAYGSGVTLTNCTMTENQTVWADNGGAIASDNYSTVNVRNSILWENGAIDYWGNRYLNQVRVFTGWSPTITYSDVQGGWYDAGNVDADPLFVSTVHEDLHLMPNSPCVGAGTSAGAPSTDLDGVQRKNPPDQGAYEVTPVTGIQAIQSWLEYMIVDARAQLSDGGQSLRAKLAAAQAGIEQGNYAAARGSLRAFANELSALIATGQLSSDQGQPLIDAAIALIQQLGG